MFPISPSDRYRQIVRLTFFRLIIIVILLLFTQRTFQEPAAAPEYFLAETLLIYLMGLFVLTLSYLIWLRTRQGLELLVRVQCAVDPVLVTVLVVLTGLANSPFHFLYGLAVLNTALLLGRREAFLAAGMVLILSVSAFSLVTILYQLPLDPSLAPLRRIIFQSAAFLLTALLGGALAERAWGLHRAFEQQKDSLADLTVLHEQVIAAMPYGLISVNNQGIIRGVNQGMEEILKESAWSLINRPLKERLPEFCWALNHAANESVYVEFKNNKFLLGLNITPLANRQGEVIGTLLVVRDLSMVKQLEQDLAAREQLALTGRMAAGVAHEIRNPLAAIISGAQILTPRIEREKRWQNNFQEEVSRLKQLSTVYLFFARPPRPERQVVILQAFFEGLMEQLTTDPRWGTHYRLLATGMKDEKIMFDPGHLRQIFWNLLINAAQATEPGSQVTITSQRRLGKLHVTLVDQGLGLDPNLLNRVLEPFFTTRSSGTGLGLSVVVQLMRLNGGTIRLENAPVGGLRVLLIMESVNG